MFHRHVWKIVSRETRQSEVAKAIAEAMKTQSADVTMDGPAGTLREYEIVTYRCEGCGTEKVQRV